MQKLKRLRKLYAFKQKDIADMLGVTTKIIKEWESNKSVPELKVLRDLAVIFGTSTYDLLYDESITTTIYTPWNTDKTIDSFWGHIGILLYNSNFIKWFPITESTAKRIESALINSEFDEQNNILSVSTLNNRLLTINKDIIKKISLLDDASDAPKDWELPWDGYQGLGSEEYYNLIEEYFWNYEHFCQNTSENLQNRVNQIIHEQKIYEDNIDELFNDVYIYFHDNTIETITIESSEALINSLIDIDIISSKFIKFLDINQEIHLVPINSIGLIDAPLNLYKQGYYNLYQDELLVI